MHAAADIALRLLQRHDANDMAALGTAVALAIEAA
jgi:hypothetical protein